MLLFLDFDGVLHPTLCAEREYFCRMPLFAAALREHAALSVVITSSWRHFHPLDSLRGHFPADIASRILGVTRDSAGRPRHEEIIGYLESNAAPATPWAALDDSRFEFPARCPNLILCDGRTGLTEEDVARLRRLIQVLGVSP